MVKYIKGERGNEKFYYDGCYNPYPFNGNDKYNRSWPVGYSYWPGDIKNIVDYLNVRNSMTKIKWRAVDIGEIIRDRIEFCEYYLKTHSLKQ